MLLLIAIGLRVCTQASKERLQPFVPDKARSENTVPAKPSA